MARLHLLCLVITLIVATWPIQLATQSTSTESQFAFADEGRTRASGRRLGRSTIRSRPVGRPSSAGTTVTTDRSETHSSADGDVLHFDTDDESDDGDLTLGQRGRVQPTARYSHPTYRT